MGNTMASVRLLLVRHGETTWNQENRWQGQADVPLSETGCVQARRLAQRLLAEGRQIQAMYTSDLSRAAQTADILGAVLGMRPVSELAWREMDIGVWSGLTTAEVIARHTAEWERIRAGEDLPRGGGETFTQFQSRLVRGAARLLEQHAGEDVAVVTHGGAVRAFLLACRKLPMSQFRTVDKIGNTGLSEVTIFANGEAVIHAVNDTRHLSEQALLGEAVDA
jgi:broad specificity phosphatase PhoE